MQVVLIINNIFPKRKKKKEKGFSSRAALRLSQHGRRLGEKERKTLIMCKETTNSDF
jgi:hypothetical protein